MSTPSSQCQMVLTRRDNCRTDSELAHRVRCWVEQWCNGKLARQIKTNIAPKHCIGETPRYANDAYGDDHVVFNFNKQEWPIPHEHTEAPNTRMIQAPKSLLISTIKISIVIIHLTFIMSRHQLVLVEAQMVRLCIASADPVKLTSQCVMCNRREFPLTTIDCTGMTRMNDLIANPLSVQEATCLIYNCRRVSHLSILLWW